MKLVDRLKPIFKDKLEIANMSHPALVGMILDDLQKEERICSLSYGTVVELQYLLGTTLSPYNFFTE